MPYFLIIMYYIIIIMVMMTGNSLGDTATYSCNNGYSLSGVNIVTCEDNGQWSDPPICVPFHTCVIIHDSIVLHYICIVLHLYEL